MNILLVILLILFGVGLLVAELFLIPGFGIAGGQIFRTILVSVASAITQKDLALCQIASLVFGIPCFFEASWVDAVTTCANSIGR